MNCRILLLASAVALAAGAAQAAPQFVNGGFEAGASTGWDLMNGTNTPGWTILYGSGSIFPRLNLNQASGGPYGDNNEGRQFATIGGEEDGATSALEQTLGGFNIGQTYTLSWLQASEFTVGDILDVTLTGATGGGSFQSNPYPGGSDYWKGWQTMTTTFVPTASAVTFHFQGSDAQFQYEVGVDNFQVSGGGVPEPAAWALMIGGFGLAGASLRRRRAVAA